MKKTIFVLITALMLISVALAGNGNTKAKLGPCVRECVHAYNPSLADSDAKQFLVADFNAEQCVQACKEGTFDGACDSGADDCCNVFYQDSDPDCTEGGSPPGAECSVNSDCASNICVLRNPFTGLKTCD